MAVYHSDYKSEAWSVINNLVMLCKEHFGVPAKVWCMEEACAAAAHCIYDQKTHTVEDNTGFENNKITLLDSFGNNLTAASWACSLANG